jgi:hypothetical protein
MKMSALRRRLSRLVAVWLTCQLAALGSPLGPCCPPLVVSGAEEHCPHVPDPAQASEHHGHTMAHGASAVPDENPENCAMRSACAPTPLAYLSLTLGLGVLPEPASVASEPTVSMLEDAGTTPHDFVHTLHSPPPRRTA